MDSAFHGDDRERTRKGLKAYAIHKPIGHPKPLIHLRHRLKGCRSAMHTPIPQPIDHDRDAPVPARQIPVSGDFSAMATKWATTLRTAAGLIATRSGADKGGKPPARRVPNAFDP
jgi:hypothetical protein